MEVGKNIKMVIEYNGSGFHGWQFQPGLRTIQSELEKTISMVLREPVRVQASGRTDAGVHARAQVVNFECKGEVDLNRLSHSVSNIMRPELSVLSAEFVPLEFNARRDSVSKQYSYQILNRKTPAVLEKGFVWFVACELNIDRMREEAQFVVGEHDFTSFRASGCTARTPVKEIFESEVVADGEHLVYRVVGSGFLKQMVRNIVGTLVGIGKGSVSENMGTILEAKDRQRAGVTAPPYGLFLDWVKYHD